MVRRAFTIIELIVVVAIIALILGIGLPAFNAMSTSAKLAKTRQLITGTLTRANAIALSDRTYTAVRFMPSAWELDDSPNSGTSMANRNTQLLATYRYVASSQDPTNVATVRFSERFERIKNGPSAILPGDTWVAPSEAMDANATAILRNGNTVNVRDATLTGPIYPGGNPSVPTGFKYNADALSENANGTYSNNSEPGQILNADDFLVVFDPATGLVGSQRRVPWRLLGYDPVLKRESGWRPNGNNSPPDFTNPYQRMNCTGVVIYPREPFVGLGLNAAATDRFNLLTRLGKRYYVSRNGGGLLEGN